MITSSRLFSEIVSLPNRSLLRLRLVAGVRRFERRPVSRPTARAGAPIITAGRETTTEDLRPGCGFPALPVGRSLCVLSGVLGDRGCPRALRGRPSSLVRPLNGIGRRTLAWRVWSNFTERRRSIGGEGDHWVAKLVAGNHRHGNWRRDWVALVAMFWRAWRPVRKFDHRIWWNVNRYGCRCIGNHVGNRRVQ